VASLDFMLFGKVLNCGKTFSYLVVGMEIKRKLGQKGQLVVPKIVREFLGVKPGDEIIMEIRGKEVFIRPEVSPEKFVEAFCSVVHKKLTEKVDLEKLLEEEVEESLVLH